MTPLEIDFPDLAKEPWSKTSDADPKYNCIAFAAGRTDVFWWPDDYSDEESDYWPHGIPREESISAFILLFQSLGYQLCPDGSLEAGHEKVAIFALGEVPTHAARQLNTGQWTSKLGPHEDIVHETPNGLAGPCYGKVVQFMRRIVTA
jgi:hypothetical protein